MIENDFKEATNELQPSRPPKSITGKKKKRKYQQTNWHDGLLSSLGCGERVNYYIKKKKIQNLDDDSDDDNEENSNNGENADEIGIPQFEKPEEKTCNIY